MNMQRRFGMLTAIAGAALALGSLTFAGSATAVEQPSNFVDVEGNITVCPNGTIQFDGPEHDGHVTTGPGSTALFHWNVTSQYVTITQIDPTVTGLTAYIKGGPAYRIYNPVIDGQSMRSPLNGGENIPALSHWMLCYTVTPLETTTTTEVVTTTTLADTTTTTVPEIVTTTTIGESEGPTTTLVATTTTEQASEGPTTTEQASEGPTTTVDAGPLPTTGGGASLPLVLGLAMTLGGIVFTLLARTPRES